MRRFREAVTACVLVLIASAAFAQTSSVSGRVVNEQGAPVPNATATLVPPPPPPMPGMPMKMPPPSTLTATSGADGAFTIGQVQSGHPQPEFSELGAPLEPVPGKKPLAA